MSCQGAMLLDIPRPNTSVSQPVLAALVGWVRALPEENVKRARAAATPPEAFSWRDIYSLLSNLVIEAEQDMPGHSQRVAEFSLRCGVVLGLTPQALKQLYWGGALHDLGKLTLSRELLGKPGPLSQAEWQLVRQHPTWGCEAVSVMLDDPQLARTVLTHHERWDGAGYPGGLKAHEIPLHGRIVAVADTFDALTSRRCYREAVTTPEALAILGAEGGKQFDPELLATVLSSGVLNRDRPGNALPEVG